MSYNNLLKIIKIIVLFIYVIRFFESLFINADMNQLDFDDDSIGENLTNFVGNSNQKDLEGFTILKVGVLMASSLGK